MSFCCFSCKNDMSFHTMGCCRLREKMTCHFFSVVKNDMSYEGKNWLSRLTKMTCRFLPLKRTPCDFGYVADAI